jgi:transcriptional regulator of arginine metabolism
VNIQPVAFVGANKRFRQGQILKLVAGEAIASQDELRRRLAHFKLRVTQATLSRDIHELQLVKTETGYKPLASAAADASEAPPLPPLGSVLREFLTDVRPAQNLLVLNTPPGGAQPLAAALDREKWSEIVGSIAGDDTILLILPSTRARKTVQKRIEDLLQ